MRTIIIVALGLCAMGTPAKAQDAAAPGDPATAGASNLAQQLSNPLASLISVPIQMNAEWGGGVADDGFKLTTNVQPVVPITLNDDANLIVRTIVPIVYQTDISAPNDSQFGLGDTIQSFFYSPSRPTASGIIWGIGPVFLYPTATSDYAGGDKWGAGPTVVMLKQSGQTTIGLLANHIWSLAGDDTRRDVSATFLNPFYSYTTRRATTFSVNTETTYDWLAEQWIVPLNFKVSQLVKVGNQPISFGIGARWYVESPSSGPDFGLQFTTTFLFPRR